MQNEELQRVRAELEAGLEKYSELYDFAPVGYVTLDRDGAILQVNLTGALLLGVERARLASKRLELFVGESDRPIFDDFLQKVFTGPANEHCEVALLRKEDNPLFVRLEGKISANGQQCRIAVSDVTERKQREKERDRLASFPQMNPNPIIEVDSSGSIIFHNKAIGETLRNLGVQEDIRVFLPDDLSEILKNLDQKRDLKFNREVMINDKVFGESIYLLPEFNVARIYAADITARKRADSLVQARLRMVVAATNLSFDQTLQMSLDEIEAQTESAIGFYHFMGDDQETLFLQNWSTNTLQNMCTAVGKGSHYPVSQAGVWVDCVRDRRPVIHNDYASLPHRKGMPPGHAPVIREMVIPILRRDRIVAIIGVGNKSTDYTPSDIEIASLLGDFSWEIVERKRAEVELKAAKEYLEAANKELEGFSYSVSHDLRAPLRHMSGFVELLQRRLKDHADNKTHSYAAAIAGAAKKMGMLIDDLLAFSRIGRSEMQKRKVSFNALVRKVVQEIRAGAKGRNIKWEIDELPDVYGDKSMLELVLVNLISNAVKYTMTSPKAEIRIGYKDDGDEFIFFVKDDGVGFNMEYVDKLFGIFQRLHSQEEFEGTGIGLANVRRIISRHGGRTWAESAMGQGATFYFTLPKEKKS
jgi:PAS domain S-box-containing protein